MVGKKLLRSLYHISNIIQVEYCRTRTPSPGLFQPIIQVCNGDKLNFSNLQKLFNQSLRGNRRLTTGSIQCLGHEANDWRKVWYCHLGDQYPEVDTI